MVNIKKLGFTLVELLVAMTIGGIVLSLVMLHYSEFLHIVAKARVQKELIDQTHFTMTKLIDQVRNNECGFDDITKTLTCDTYKFIWDGTEKLELTLDTNPAQSIVDTDKFKVTNFDVEKVNTGLQEHPGYEIQLTVQAIHPMFDDLEISPQVYISSRQY